MKREIDMDFSALIVAQGSESQCAVRCLETPSQAPDLWDQFLVLRYRAFGKWEGADPLIGREFDKKDQYSTFILVVWEGVVLAGCRLIDGEQVAINLDPRLIDSERHFEISRMLIRSEIKERTTRDRLMFNLCQAVAWYAFEQRGYSDLYNDTRLPFHQALRTIFGPALQEIGPPHEVKKQGETLILMPSRVNRADAEAMRRQFATRLERPPLDAVRRVA